MSHETKVLPIVTTDLAELQTPGVMVEVTADVAESMGYIADNALYADDAWESNGDLEGRAHG